MRTIKELLQLMLDNQQSLKSGLCLLASQLHLNDLIDKAEPRIKWLQKHINKN